MLPPKDDRSLFRELLPVFVVVVQVVILKLAFDQSWRITLKSWYLRAQQIFNAENERKLAIARRVARERPDLIAEAEAITRGVDEG